MRCRWTVLLLACLLFSKVGAAHNAAPAKPKVTRILFLLDASGSMMAPWEGQPRWNVAKRMLSKMVDSLNSYPNLEVALRVYGHQFLNADKNCEDSRLEVPFAPQRGRHQAQAGHAHGPGQHAHHLLAGAVGQRFPQR